MHESLLPLRVGSSCLLGKRGHTYTGHTGWVKFYDCWPFGKPKRSSKYCEKLHFIIVLGYIFHIFLIAQMCKIIR